MGLLKWFDAYLERIIMIVSLVVLSSLLMFQVIMRYVFKSAFGWPEELSRYCFIVFVFFSCAYCVRNDKNFRIDALLKIMPVVLRNMTELLIQLASLGFYGLLAYVSVDAVRGAMSTGQLTPGLQMPLYFLYGAVGLALFVTTIRNVQAIALLLRNFGTPKTTAEH